MKAKLQEGDCVEFKNDSHIFARKRGNATPKWISEIEVCSDRDKECPKTCPGRISLGTEEPTCYACETTDGDYAMIIMHSGPERRTAGLLDHMGLEFLNLDN